MNLKYILFTDNTQGQPTRKFEKDLKRCCSVAEANRGCSVRICYLKI